MIIDIHTHFFPPKIAASALQTMQSNCHSALFSDGTEDGLMESKKKAGIDLAVVQPVATNPEKVNHINDSAIRINQYLRETGLLSFGGMHPACPYWEQELERIREAGIIGIKLHPAYISVDIDDPRTIAVLRKCRDLGLIVLIHSGKDIGIPGATEALPSKIRNALDQVGPMKMIAAHMGGWKCWQEGKKLLSDTGIFIDTAFSLGELYPASDHYTWNDADLQLLTEEAFCELIYAYGADRILFGTDSPWTEPRQEVEKIKKLPLSQAKVNQILGENAVKLLYTDDTHLFE